MLLCLKRCLFNKQHTDPIQSDDININGPQFSWHLLRNQIELNVNQQPAGWPGCVSALRLPDSESDYIYLYIYIVGSLLAADDDDVDVRLFGLYRESNETND